MPVIIIGADTRLGPAVVDALTSRVGEVRAFVSAVEVLDDLRARGVKAAAGDVSDGSHVGGAALNAFAAVLLPDAATDDRDRAFASTPDAVYAQWADGLRDAGITRAIWVSDDPIPPAIEAAAAEAVAVPVAGRPSDEIARDVARLDEAAQL